MLETHISLCLTDPDFSGKKICPKNWESGPKMGPKSGFFEFIEKSGH